MAHEHKHGPTQPIPALAGQHIGEILGMPEAGLFELEQNPVAFDVAQKLTVQRDAQLNHYINASTRNGQTLDEANNELHEAVDRYRKHLQQDYPQ